MPVVDPAGDAVGDALAGGWDAGPEVPALGVAADDACPVAPVEGVALLELWGLSVTTVSCVIAGVVGDAGDDEDTRVNRRKSSPSSASAPAVMSSSIERDKYHLPSHIESSNRVSTRTVPESCDGARIGTLDSSVYSGTFNYVRAWLRDGGPPSQSDPMWDGFRAVSALTVLVYHVVSLQPMPVALGNVVEVFGKTGVLAFFALSAFLLSRPWVDAFVHDPETIRTPSWWRFYARRALRVLPAFWVTWLVTYLLVNQSFQGVSSPESLRQLLLVNPFVFEERWGLIGVAWSVSAEVTFYLVLPVVGGMLLASALGRRVASQRGRVLLALGSLGVASVLVALARPLFLGVWPALSMSLVSRLDFFLVGIAVAVLLSAGWTVSRRHLRWVSILVVLVALGASAVGYFPAGVIDREPASETVSLGLTLLVTAILFGHLLKDGHSPVRAILRTSLLTWLGLVSYGLFLWHGTVLRVGYQWQPAGTVLEFAVRMAVVIAICVALASVSYYLIERPGMRWAARKFPTGRTRPDGH